MPITHIVGKMPDTTTIKLFDAIEEEFGKKHRTHQYGEIVLAGEDIESLRKKSSPTYLLTNSLIHPEDNLFRLDIKSKANDAYFDEITITPQTNTNPVMSAAQAIRLDAIIRSIVTFPKLSTPNSTASTSVGLLEKQIASLADLHERMIAETAEVRANLEAQYAESRTQLNQERADADAELKLAERGSLERIAKDREALEERIKEFDFSDHQRARRKQREEISSQVQEFLTLPQGNYSTRWKFSLLIVAIFAISLMAGSFAFLTFQEFIQVAQRLSNAGPIDPVGSLVYLVWILGARGVLLTIVCLGLGIYGINLLRRSHDEELVYQRELRRYGMDINRASWVIETAMEMTTKEGAILPEKWIEGAVSGLFHNSPKQEADVTPLSALGAILSLGPEMSVGPGGASFKIPPKGSKMAAKEGE
jgi:hypothetical protein